MFRALALFLALTFAAGHAAAQTADAPPPAATSEQQGVEAAVFEVYQALFFDTGIFDAIAEQMYPAYREAALNSDYYHRARGAERDALMQLIERTPDILREEVATESHAMAERVAPRAATLMSEVDIRELATFLRAPEWRPFMQRMALSGAGGKDKGAGPTAEETAQMDALMATEAGRRLERSTPLLDLLAEELNAASPRIEARLTRRIAWEICTILAARCPQDLRDRAGEL